MQTPKPLRHFVKHLFLANKVYIETKKAREDVYSHLGKMRKSIIRMNLTYSDVDRLRQKIDKLIDYERKYAKFFKPEDSEADELKSQINALEQELKNEREEKSRMQFENEEKIRQLSESLNSIKNRMNSLLMDKAKRQQRLNALDRRISQKVDIHSFYHK